MTITVERTEPDAPEAAALLAALDAEIAPLYPPAQRFAYSADEIRASGMAFFVARLDGTPAGCGGLERRGDKGEVKRMYVDAAMRGRGVADALLGRIEEEAVAQGLAALRLETGTFQQPALAFYRRVGFRDIPPYGEYVGSPTSVCMEKAL